MKLSLKNLQLRQGTFLLELDLEITGQVIGIFGNSGAGKTSLIEIVAGLRKTISGRMHHGRPRLDGHRNSVSSSRRNNATSATSRRTSPSSLI